MHRASWVVLFIATFCLSTAAQQLAPSPSAQRVQVTSPASEHPQPGRQQDSPTGPFVTNASVIRMAQAGVPESAILASIHAGPVKFDLSPDALLALHRSGVSQKILEAMMADGSARRATPSHLIKLGPMKAGSIVKNPRALQADTAIIAVLEKQRKAGELEASQMTKAGMRPVGLQTGPAQPMSAMNRSQSPTSMQMQKGATPGMISPSNVPGSASSASARLTAPLQNTALTCAHDPTMRILNVSGDFSPATFTPDAKYNFYTVTGCSFGNPGPNAKVYIYYKDTFHQQFQIQEWSENGIKLNLDPSLRGVLDHDNLTLVVQRSDGQQASKSGFKFYAARDTTLLGHIPPANFSLNHFTLTNTADLQPTYTSPSSPRVIPDVGGYTAEVSWDCTDCFANGDRGGFAHYAQPGEDVYQFKNLQPGFVPAQASLASVDLDCTPGTIHREGDFDLQWVGDDLHARWQGQTCAFSGCGGFDQTDCFASAPNGSNYAVNVWVTGPRGIEPWTGKPQ